MRFLLDTHILLWASAMPERLPHDAREVIDDEKNELFFSVASLWEIAVKNNLGRADFNVDLRILRRELLNNGYHELPIFGAHILTLQTLPPIHKDPFDRILVAQSSAQSMTLLTADAALAEYKNFAPVRMV